MSLQDDLRDLYEHALVCGLWHWEAGNGCREDGFATEAECDADFERFIATLED